MVIANTSDGETRSYNLTIAEQHKALLALIRSGRVTALSIHLRGVQHSLPLPRRFRRPVLGAEHVFNGTAVPIGERVYAQADGVRVALTATFSGAVIRCDVENTGRQRFDPAGGRD
jgi:hypothetical protein